jgi:hypothetical protein
MREEKGIGLSPVLELLENYSTDWLKAESSKLMADSVHCTWREKEYIEWNIKMMNIKIRSALHLVFVCLNAND